LALFSLATIASFARSIQLKSNGDDRETGAALISSCWIWKSVIIAEVTTAWDVAIFARKAVELLDKGREKVRRQLVAGFKAYPNIAEWPIEIHLFVREDREADLRKLLDSRKLQFKAFTLEHAFRRWKWDAN
jgi:hypothetical protein